MPSGLLSAVQSFTFVKIGWSRIETGPKSCASVSDRGNGCTPLHPPPIIAMVAPAETLATEIANPINRFRMGAKIGVGDGSVNARPQLARAVEPLRRRH